MDRGMRSTRDLSGLKWSRSRDLCFPPAQAGQVITIWECWSTPEEIPCKYHPGGNIQSLYCATIPEEKDPLPLVIARIPLNSLDLRSRFVPSPDNTQMWIVYHATPSPHDGWANRKAHCQPLELRSGLPYAGHHPLPEGTYRVPSGSFIPAKTTPLPETVMGPMPSKSDPDTKKVLEKGKKFWRSLKKSFS